MILVESESRQGCRKAVNLTIDLDLATCRRFAVSLRSQSATSMEEKKASSQASAAASTDDMVKEREQKDTTLLATVFSPCNGYLIAASNSGRINVWKVVS